jgi:hypothetical protein
VVNPQWLLRPVAWSRGWPRSRWSGSFHGGLPVSSAANVTLAAEPGWPPWLLFLFAAAFGATAVGWNGVFLAEVAHLAPAGRISEATGGCLFFTFLGVVVTPPAFNGVLALAGNYAMAYAAFGIPAFAIGAWLLASRRVPSGRAH